MGMGDFRAGMDGWAFSRELRYMWTARPFFCGKVGEIED